MTHNLIKSNRTKKNNIYIERHRCKISLKLVRKSCKHKINVTNQTECVCVEKGRKTQSIKIKSVLEMKKKKHTHTKQMCAMEYIGRSHN